IVPPRKRALAAAEVACCLILEVGVERSAVQHLHRCTIARTAGDSRRGVERRASPLPYVANELVHAAKRSTWLERIDWRRTTLTTRPQRSTPSFERVAPRIAALR